MTRVLIGKDLVLEGPRLKIEDKQLPVNMFAKKKNNKERETERVNQSSNLKCTSQKTGLLKKNLVFKWTKDKKDTTHSIQFSG